MSAQLRWLLAAALLLCACDSGDDDDGTESMGTAPDAGPPPKPTRSFGDPCTDSRQCMQSACVRVAERRSVCSWGCKDRGNCPDADNWGCVPVPDMAGQKVCACQSDGTREVCGDGRDNDCDGVVDCERDKPDAGAHDSGTGGSGSTDACPAGGCVTMDPDPCVADPALCPVCVDDDDCDDGVACTADACRAGGCVNTPRDAACGQGQVCDLKKGCGAGTACARDADCADDNACTQAEYCDPAARVCRFALLDGDGDEHYPSVCGGDDCDDTDSRTFRGALDVCDGRDNDCNGSVDPMSSALSCGPERVCSGGRCACDADHVECKGACITDAELDSDPRNCGACGNSCTTGMRCQARTCVAIDECAETAGLCGTHSLCTNLAVGFQCSCEQGFTSATGSSCLDVDECLNNSDGCDDSPQACVNMEGSFACQCPAGYAGIGTGVNGCADVNECATGALACAAPTPVCSNQVGSASCGRKVVQIVDGFDHHCALFDNGVVRCWGSNTGGVLGYGDTTPRGRFAGQMGDDLPNVNLGSGRSAVAIASGNVHTCALLDDASIKCWGNNEEGQLGYEDFLNRGDGPGEMGDALAAVDLGTGRTAQAVYAGGNHTCAILDNAALKCWGQNYSGELGLGSTAQTWGGQDGEMGDGLDAVDLGVGRTVKQLALGAGHTCAILDDDGLRCWGDNYNGKLGHGSTVGIWGTAPEHMGAGLPVVQLGDGRTARSVATGESHTCAVLDDATLRCWGINTNGELGIGATGNRGSSPTQMGNGLPAINLGAGRTALSVSAAAVHTCAVLDNHGVKCWGANGQGQLGQGDLVARGTTAASMTNLGPIQLGAGRSAAALSLGQIDTCVLFDDGAVKCFGASSSGQLGYGDSLTRGDSAAEMGDALPVVALGK